MSMWEPFSEPARRVVVMAQEIAQSAGHNHIGTDHLTCALMQSDSEAGRVMASAVDRAAIEGGWTQSQTPRPEMVFTPGAKNAIEMSFENTRRVGDDYMGTKHLAIGILDSTGPPPLLPGMELSALRTELDNIAEAPHLGTNVWRKVLGEAELHPVAVAFQRALPRSNPLAPPGTRVTLSIAEPDEPERAWTWCCENPGPA